jgi:predicted nucleic acid-binding protein
MEDFEDAVQAVAAQWEGIEVVVTRDKNGFKNFGMTVFTPQEFLTFLDK